MPDPKLLPPPKPSSHPVDVGLRSEAAVIHQLVGLGYAVLLPTGVNQRYDVVIDTGERMLRAQIKTARLRNGVVEFATRSTRINSGGCFWRSYEGEVDLFLAYCRELDRTYAVPVEDAPTHQMFLRVEPTRNRQRSGVNLAERYELPRPG
jgi:hypothetical protein